MPQGYRGSGIVAAAGLGKRRDDPAAYSRAWHAANREKNNAYHRDYYHTHIAIDPEKVAKHNEAGVWARRKAKYGITKEEFRDLLTQQAGACNICGSEIGDQLRVDHDHETGEIRGLLCANCNAGLGMFCDDPDKLRTAATYLEQHLKKRG